jgi:hypothetical protein
LGQVKNTIDPILPTIDGQRPVKDRQADDFHARDVGP